MATPNVSQSSPQPLGQGGGYRKLASIMTTNPEFTIFRRFADLNNLNLLRLQAHLQVLEEELQEIQEEDRTSGAVDRLDLNLDFQALRDSRNGANRYQLEKFEQIACVLKEYNDALIQASTLDKLPTPSTIQLQEYRKWLVGRRECGVNFPREWEDPYVSHLANDQLTFRESNPEHDPITSLIQGPIISLIHRVRGRSKAMSENGIIKYSDHAVERTTKVISAAISSLLPTICIIVLYFIPNLIVRLEVMVVFTIIFSMALAFFTSGKKHEIFSATAAFAAVEVVFIGSTSYIGTAQNST